MSDKAKVSRRVSNGLKETINEYVTERIDQTQDNWESERDQRVNDLYAKFITVGRQTRNFNNPRYDVNLQGIKELLPIIEGNDQEVNECRDHLRDKGFEDPDNPGSILWCKVPTLDEVMAAEQMREQQATGTDEVSCLQRIKGLLDYKGFTNEELIGEIPSRNRLVALRVGGRDVAESRRRLTELGYVNEDDAGKILWEDIPERDKIKYYELIEQQLVLKGWFVEEDGAQVVDTEHLPNRNELDRLENIEGRYTDSNRELIRLGYVDAEGKVDLSNVLPANRVAELQEGIDGGEELERVTQELIQERTDHNDLISAIIGLGYVDENNIPDLNMIPHKNVVDDLLQRTTAAGLFENFDPENLPEIPGYVIMTEGERGELVGRTEFGENVEAARVQGQAETLRLYDDDFTGVAFNVIMDEEGRINVDATLRQETNSERVREFLGAVIDFYDGRIQYAENAAREGWINPNDLETIPSGMVYMSVRDHEQAVVDAVAEGQTIAQAVAGQQTGQQDEDLEQVVDQEETDVQEDIYSPSTWGRVANIYRSVRDKIGTFIDGYRAKSNAKVNLKSAVGAYIRNSDGDVKAQAEQGIIDSYDELIANDWISTNRYKVTSLFRSYTPGWELQGPERDRIAGELYDLVSNQNNRGNQNNQNQVQNQDQEAE